MRTSIKIFLFMILATPVFADTHYMATTGTDSGNCTVTPCLTFDHVFDEMAGGDTLEIADGTYNVGTLNRLTDATFPPNGSAGNYTTVQAENNGAVTFDGQDTNRAMLVYGGSTHQYIQFEGIRWINADGKLQFRANHIKFFRCGGEYWYPEQASYFLLEECYAWGAGRYGFSAYQSNYGIVRRFVVRLDAAAGGGLPVAGVQNYASNHMEYQNVIALDMDEDDWTDVSYYSGGMTIRQSNGSFYSNNVAHRGCIVLNYKSDEGNCDSAAITLGHDQSTTNVIENSVYWDVSGGFCMGADSGTGPYNIDHVTIYVNDARLTTHGFHGYDGQSAYVDFKDSIIMGATNGFYRFDGSHSYALLYDNTTNYSSSSSHVTDYSSENGTAINPIYNASTNPTGGLRYIVRAEDGSNIATHDSTGGKLGAQIEYRYGASGTLYGETGYATLTEEKLWPFPYEDVIREHFIDADEPPDSERGFGASGQTLTDYIWEYMGSSVGPTYYVKNGGNNSLDGLSDANAWATVAKVNSSVSTTGANVFFKRDSSWTNDPLVIDWSGTVSDYAEVGAYGEGDNPIIYITSGSTSGVAITRQEYFDLSNIEFRGTSTNTSLWEMADFRGIQNANIHSCYFLSAVGVGVRLAGSKSPDRYTENVHFYDNSIRLTPMPVETPASDAIQFSKGVRNCRVYRNTITQFHHDAINMNGGPDTTFSTLPMTGNWIYENDISNVGQDYGHGIDIHGPEGMASGNRIFNNYVHDLKGNNQMNGDHNLYYGNLFVDIESCVYPGGQNYDCDYDSLYWNFGTAIVANSWENGQVGNYNKYYNNTIVNTQNAGILIGSGDAISIGNEFINNVLYNTANNPNARAPLAQHPFAVRNSTTYVQNIKVQNNIVYTAGETPFRYSGSNMTASTFNSSDRSGDTISGNMDSNPLLNDTGSDEFWLQSGSPGVDTGLSKGDPYDAGLSYTSSWPSAVVTVDRDDEGEGWDIGAYENEDAITIVDVPRVIMVIVQ